MDPASVVKAKTFTDEMMLEFHNYSSIDEHEDDAIGEFERLEENLFAVTLDWGCSPRGT